MPILIRVDFPALDRLVDFLEADEQSQIDAITTQVQSATARLKTATDRLKTVEQQEQ